MLTVQCFTFNPLGENTYIVYNEEGACCIIDPGAYTASEQQILTAFVEDKGLKPEWLLNTHCHLDHIFSNAYCARRWGLPLHLHPLEEPVLALGPASGQLWGLSLDPYDGPKAHLQEGVPVRLGAEELEVILAPGHSPGSVVFYSRAHKFLIGGDVLFQGSVGRTDLPGGSFEVLEASIRTKLYTLPGDVTVHPGHGDSTTIGQEQRSNPFVRLILPAPEKSGR